MSLLPFWALTMVVVLLSMQGQKPLGFHPKYLNLCSEDERRSCAFGTTRSWVINDRTSKDVRLKCDGKMHLSSACLHGKNNGKTVQWKKQTKKNVFQKTNVFGQCKMALAPWGFITGWRIKLKWLNVLKSPQDPSVLIHLIVFCTDVFEYKTHPMWTYTIIQDILNVLRNQLAS